MVNITNEGTFVHYVLDGNAQAGEQIAQLSYTARSIADGDGESALCCATPETTASTSPDPTVPRTGVGHYNANNEIRKRENKRECV